MTRSIISILTVCLMCMAGTVHAGVRVALISTCGGDAGKDVLSLAEAELSKQEGIELLERTEVARILEEQKLARCGLWNASLAVAAGKILKVEVFATLETMGPDKKALGLVAFDGITGVRLVDITLSGENLKNDASQIAKGVMAACAKQQIPGQGGPAVCLMPVVNADLPQSQDGLCNAISRLLERELARADGITLLERQRLEFINQERDLANDQTTNDLRLSTLIIHLELAQGFDGKQLVLSARILDSKGIIKGRYSVTADEEDVPGLVRGIAENMAAGLHVALSPEKLDRKAEAERFLQEAVTYWALNDFERACTLAEASYALCPERNDIRNTLAGTVANHALDMYTRGRRHIQMSRGPLDTDRHIFRTIVMARKALDLIKASGPPLIDSKASQTNDQVNAVAYASKSSAQTLITRHLTALSCNIWPKIPDTSGGNPFQRLVFYGSEKDILNAIGTFSQPWKDIGFDAQLFEYITSYRTYFSIGERENPYLRATIGAGSPIEKLMDIVSSKGYDANVLNSALNNMPKGKTPDSAALLHAMDMVMRVLERPLTISEALFSRKAQFRERLDYARYQLLRQHPELGFNPSMPWERVEVLLDVKDARNGIRRLFVPQVTSDAVYLIGTGVDANEGRCFLQLIRIDTADGEVSLLGKYHTGKNGCLWMANADMSSVVTGVLRTAFLSVYWDHVMYVWVNELGLLAFPADGTDGTQIISPQSLPTERILSLDTMDGTIYLGSDYPGYLIAYDVATGKQMAVVASRRRSTQTTLEGTAAFKMPLIKADPIFKRIYCVTCINNRVDGGENESGIWMYDKASNAVSMVCAWRDLEWMWGKYGATRMKDGRMMVVYDKRVMTYDCNTLPCNLPLPFETMNGIYMPNGTKVSLKWTYSDAEYRKNTPVWPLYRLKGQAWVEPAEPVNGWLWTAEPWSRFSLDGSKREDLMPLREDDAKTGYFFAPRVLIQAVNDGKELLVCDPFTLWRLTLTQPVANDDEKGMAK